MCVPLAVAAAGAAAVVSAAGQVMGGLQAKAQGKYQMQVDRINEGLAVDAAHQSILAGRDEARDYWRKVAQVKGQQIASMAANGIDVGYGTAERVQEDTQMLAEDDAKNLYRQTEERTKGHLIEASNYRMAGTAARTQGNNAFVSSLFGAGASLLGGLSQAGALKAKMTTGGG